MEKLVQTMGKGEIALNKVGLYLKKNPKETVRDAIKACGVNYHTYYSASTARNKARQAEKKDARKSPGPKPKYEKIVSVQTTPEPVAALATRNGMRCIVLQGTAEEVQAALRGLQ